MPGILAAVLQRPLDDQVGHPGEVLNVGREHDGFAEFGLNRGVKIVGEAGDRRGADLADGVGVLLVDDPQRVADHLERDRIEFGGGFGMQAQLRAMLSLSRGA